MAGGVPDEEILRLRAGPPLLRRLHHRQSGSVANVPGGVPGEGDEEAGDREVHGGRVQLRRHGGVQDGGAAARAGAGDGDLRVDPGDDGLHKQSYAGGAGVLVVVGAPAADVREGM